jgi:transposase
MCWPLRPSPPPVPDIGELLRCMRTLGNVARVGVECTGAYGAGLRCHLEAAGVEVLEVMAGDRADRRRRVKNDTIDAENAARAALRGIRTVTPKTRDGMTESLQVLRVVRTSAVSSH